VFEQEQDIADLPLFSQRDQPLLQAETGSVINCAELDKGNQSLLSRNQDQKLSPQTRRTQRNKSALRLAENEPSVYPSLSV
jgi:hypothetical protein